MPGYVIGNFFIYSIINAFTPVPGNILALNTVTNHRWKKGRPLFLGISAGYYVVQLICAVFVYGVSAFLPGGAGRDEICRRRVHSLAGYSYRTQPTRRGQRGKVGILLERLYCNLSM